MSRRTGSLVSLLVGLWVFPVSAAAPPRPRPDDRRAEKTLREVAGTAEFLRSLPKRFGTLLRVDAVGRRVTLRFEGEKTSREWPLIDDAEIKIDGWWGRLDQLEPGERVWVWLKTDRKGRPTAVAMLADDLSQQDIHGVGMTVRVNGPGKIVLRRDRGPDRVLDTTLAEAHRGTAKVAPASFPRGSRIFVRARDRRALLLLDAEAFEVRRARQREVLRKRWLDEGLPGSVSVVHIFSGEMEMLLDHEGMRWGRSLARGDRVTLMADPPIAAVVRSVQPWRERTQLRLVARSADLADLRSGQRLNLKRPAPSGAVEASRLPPDLDRSRTREERIDWFLASIYCTCGVRGDTCTGHFYTLASCNPNSCGKPNQMRRRLAALIDRGMSDREILEKLLAEEGPGLLQPHLLP